MRSIFQRLAGEWPQLHSSLHVYALPDPDDERWAATVARYHAAIRHSDVCAVQPPEFLHATIARTPAFLDTADPDRVRRLDALLAGVAGRHAPFTLELQPPQPHGEALITDGAPEPAWDALLADVRAAVSDAFPDEPLPRGPHAPHVSLGYGTRETDDAPLLAELERLAAEAPWQATLRVDALHLLSVEAVPDPGLFRWETLAVFPLTGY